MNISSRRAPPALEGLISDLAFQLHRHAGNREFHIDARRGPRHVDEDPAIVRQGRGTDATAHRDTGCGFHIL
jgi:hypothetical protein